MERDLTLGMAAPADRKVDAPHADVRFGLVLYGGVSLAIYIYGVVFEFWRLMKASEGTEENAWSALLEEAHVTAGVDVISGASAGGINGVLLAKVIAGGGDLGRVRKIWVDNGDFAELLRPPSESTPSSLLRSELFEQLMEEGLADLEPTGPRTPLGTVLDLFIAGTRLRSWGRTFRTELGGTIDTRQYRKEFALKLRTAGFNPEAAGRGCPRDDFVEDNNALLAKVARATSAFPAAFDPQKLSRADDPESLVFADNEPDAAYFSDGGILHNKPFTETLDTILGRAADTRVRRWLVSVEPDPEESEEAQQGEPEVDEVISKSVFGIPSYQSIAGDLERLEAHRRYAARQTHLMERLEAPIAARLARDEPIDEHGRQAYANERLAQLAADLAAEIAAVAKLSEAGERSAEEGLLVAVGTGRLSEHTDFSFERRRIYFLLKRLSPLLAGGSAETPDMRPFARRLWAQFDRIARFLRLHLKAGEMGEAVRRLGSLEDDALQAEVLAFAGRMADPLKRELDQVRTQTGAICAEIDEARAQSPAAPAEQPLSFVTARRHYELWDIFLVPVDPLAGFARDRINLARISPRDTPFTGKPAEDKLAGDSLGHFGGFLKKEWRENDILWGRLDAAEQIAGMVGAELSDDKREAHIRAVQAEIVKDERPEATGDYIVYLNKDHKVGSETLQHVGGRKLATLALDAAGVARKMLARLGQSGEEERGRLRRKAYRHVGRGLGFLLTVARWPVKAIWRR